MWVSSLIVTKLLILTKMIILIIIIIIIIITIIIESLPNVDDNSNDNF